MKDRIPTYPGRVKLVPVAGQADTYDMVRADEPIEEGTPLNKASLLQDSTATAIGLDTNSDPTVDDALAYISKSVMHIGLQCLSPETGIPTIPRVETVGPSSHVGLGRGENESIINFNFYPESAREDTKIAFFQGATFTRGGASSSGSGNARTIISISCHTDAGMSPEIILYDKTTGISTLATGIIAELNRIVNRNLYLDFGVALTPSDNNYFSIKVHTTRVDGTGSNYAEVNASEPLMRGLLTKEVL